MAYRNVSVWLEDILLSMERIKHHIKSITSVSDFISNTLVTDAMERNLMVIAEAVKNAIRLEPQLPISNYRKIINLRNIITHQYYAVEPIRIWTILQEDIPVLEKEVRTILEDYERKMELNEL